MKAWLKRQTTEFTAWIGFFLCVSVFFVPDWVTFLMGVLLIAIDDEKAKAWVAKLSPKAGAWIERWSQ